MFVKKPSDYDHNPYYQNLFNHYDNNHGANGIPGPINKEAMDRAFNELVVGRAPNPLKAPFADLPREEMDVAIRAAFQLGPEIEWRWPGPNEHIYDRGDDGDSKWNQMGYLVLGLL
ncbi:hypothetical protein POM88_012413 [Heracleum sosnowskyi]|uniref:Uncharacterized protein n=1 Tax=Heracleum sosnowskyi TaxID=360622 RepID=A0AAD8IZW8_9APIA|nr:hypothetical protein POM88_012413 [Heracleum sosnowskyi]